MSEQSAGIKQQLQYGLWPSPIDADRLAAAARLDDLAWEGDLLLVHEVRAGRGVLCAIEPDGDARDLTDTHEVRARVGYGGGALATAGETVVFVERGGQLWQQPLGPGAARPITPPFGHAASPAPSPDGTAVLYVHSHDGEDVLAIAPLDGASWPQRLVAGADFYMQPTWHPDGERIAWIEWDHPNMPWDGVRLQLATVRREAGGFVLGERRHVAGDPSTCVFQPCFSPDGQKLAFVGDESGWGNLQLLDLTDPRATPRALTRRQAELDRPAWIQGLRTLAWASDSRAIFAIENARGFDRLLRVALDGSEPQPLAGLEAYTSLAQPSVGGAAGGVDRVALIASSARIPPRVVILQADRARVARRSQAERLRPGDLSPPEAVSWRANDHSEVFGLLYRPLSAGFEGAGGLPPAIVSIHGGPTSQSVASYNPRAQFFTSRGFAYLEVNYRGSTGYGRAYRQALRELWGVLDVEDAVGGRRFLAHAGVADDDRIAIMGGSAGGYTVLKALCDHPGVFAAGIVNFGVSNLFTLAADTHKFEARYLDSLVGPLPETAARYRERSPLFAADRIVDPVAIFQGSEDKVVPPNQAEAIVASLRRRGVAHEYHLYQGEEHGWRQPETIRRYYRDLERFLRQQLIFR